MFSFGLRGHAVYKKKCYSSPRAGHTLNLQLSISGGHFVWPSHFVGVCGAGANPPGLFETIRFRWIISIRF